MKIKVYPRSYFEDIKGNRKEKFIFENCNVISILSSYNYNPIHNDVPFSKKYKNNKNVLVLEFDDIFPFDYNLNIKYSQYKLFNIQHAQKIIKFLNTIDKSKTLYVHCTAGISRSGAVGECIDKYINVCNNNHSDHKFFEYFNRDYIMPNNYIRRVLLKQIYEHDNNFNITKFNSYSYTYNNYRFKHQKHKDRNKQGNVVWNKKLDKTLNTITNKN